MVNQKLPAIRGDQGQPEQVILAAQQKTELLLKEFGIDMYQQQQRQNILMDQMPEDVDIETKYDIGDELNKFEENSRNKVNNSQYKPIQARNDMNNSNNNNSNSRMAEQNEVDEDEQDRLFNELLQQRRQLDQKISQAKQRRKQQSKDNSSIVGHFNNANSNNNEDEPMMASSMNPYKVRINNLLDRNGPQQNQAAQRLQQAIERKKQMQQKMYSNVGNGQFDRNSAGYQSYLQAKKRAIERGKQEQYQWQQAKMKRNEKMRSNKRQASATAQVMQRSHVTSN